MSLIKAVFRVMVSLAMVQIMTTLAQENREKWLTPQNDARSAVGFGPLTWDNKLADYARNYANQKATTCEMKHSGGPYGENLSWSSGDMSVALAVSLWVNEKQYYNHDANSCAPGQVCGHYTQVVWRNTKSVGCAKVGCSNGGTFAICSYNPPGNIIGQFPRGYGVFDTKCSLAQENPDQWLNPHNDARSVVGVGPLTWDNKLADYARNYANQKATSCELVHSGGPYGENLSMSTGDMSVAGAVSLWVNEKQYYNYDANSCASGQQCGHYTQVVWRNTKSVGCAKVGCNTGGTFAICSYNPPGNYIGERPY